MAEGSAVPVAADGFPAYLGDSGRAEISEHVNSLAQQVLEGQVGFLFGAGLSIGSRKAGAPHITMPAGDALAIRMLEQIVGPSLDESVHRLIAEIVRRFPLEAVAQAFYHWKGGGSDSTRDDAIHKFLSDELTGYDLNEGHKALARLCSQVGCPILPRLYTTNFDDLIETALERNGRTVTPSTAAELIAAERDGKIAVVHLHGAIKTHDCQLVEQDVTATDQALKALFKADLFMRDFVFVGYSLRDPDLGALYREFRYLLKAGGRRLRTYVVDPIDADLDAGGASDEEKTRRAVAAHSVCSKVWAGREAILLPLSACAFLRLLSEAVLSSKEYRRREQLAARLGMTPVQLADRLGQPRQRSHALREPVVMGYVALLASLEAGGDAGEKVT